MRWLYTSEELGYRVVSDPDTSFGHQYRARVMRDGRRWRCTIDRHFIGWSEHRSKGRFRSEQDAEAWGTRWLDAMEAKHDGRKLTTRAASTDTGEQ